MIGSCNLTHCLSVTVSFKLRVHEPKRKTTASLGLWASWFLLLSLCPLYKSNSIRAGQGGVSSLAYHKSVEVISLSHTPTMGAIFIACYPRPADGNYKFDLDYYINVHMPLQLKHHGPYGMRSYHVIVPEKETPYGKCPYVVQTIEHWDSVEGFYKALEEASEETAADIANYTDIKNSFPIIGLVKTSWKDPSFEFE